MKTVPLGTICEINPRDNDSSELSDSSEVSFLPMAAVGEMGAGVIEEQTRLLGEVRKGYTPFRRDDVLIAKITPCFQNGKVAIATISREVGFGTTEFHVMRPYDGKLDSRYLFHFLRQPRIHEGGIRRMTGTGGQLRVPATYFSELAIFFPPLAEQKRIAAVLDKADALRAKRRQALATLDTLLQSIFLDMFGDPVTNPKGWQRHALGDLLSAIESGWSPVCEDRPARGCEWSVLKLGGVTWCEFDPAENKALLPDVDPDHSLEIMPGDLLMSRKNTLALVAAAAFVFETPPRVLLPDLVYRLVFKANAGVIAEFLWQQLIHPGRRSQIQRLAGGSAGSMPNISKEKLRGIIVEVPPLKLQSKFKEIVWSHRRQHILAERSAQVADHLFAALQSAAFAGTLFDRPARSIKALATAL